MIDYNLLTAICSFFIFESEGLVIFFNISLMLKKNDYDLEIFLRCVTNVHFACFPQVPNRQVFRTGFRTGRLAEQAWRVALASPWLSPLKCGTRDERSLW